MWELSLVSYLWSFDVSKETLLVTNVPSVGRFNQLTTWIVTFQGITCLHMCLKPIVSLQCSELLQIPELEPCRELKQVVSKKRYTVYCDQSNVVCNCSDCVLK